MYRKKGRGWTKHIDFMLLDVLCMQIAFIVSYIWRFGPGNPYTDKDYRILAAAFLLIDFFVEIVSDAFKNVLKRGYLDELIATCKHVVLVEIITTFFLFTTQMGEIYSRMSYYIMIPIYILVSYSGRVVLKNIIKKRGFASSKKSLFVIAPEKLLEETLQGLKENGFGYTQIVAAATDADLKGKTICEIPIFYCALPALIIGLCAGHRLFLSSIECNIQSSVKDFVFSYKKSLFVGKSEDCSS